MYYRTLRYKKHLQQGNNEKINSPADENRVSSFFNTHFMLTGQTIGWTILNSNKKLTIEDLGLLAINSIFDMKPCYCLY